MEVYGTDEYANPGCRQKDITVEYRQFIDFSVSMRIVEYMINLENDQSYPLTVRFYNTW